MNSRAIAAITLAQVLPLSRKGEFQGRSLNDALPQALAKYGDDDKPLIQALCFGVCRQYTWLDQIANQLIRQAFKPKDADLHGLLLVGLYQLYFLRIPDHAAIAETVEGARQLNKNWAVKVINGMLRNAQREKNKLTSNISDSLAVKTSHPKWLVDALTAAWPSQAEKILAANNEPGPMTLRVNAQVQSRETFLSALENANIPASAGELSPDAVTLKEPTDVSKLPGFAEGSCFVQDEAAQLAAHILDPQPGDKVLDACAAPGGKTTHLLEKQQNLAVTAIDCDENRVARIHENLQRLHLSAEVVCQDLADYCQQQPSHSFDRILLDVPCSATGVIRRHPDIKWLRKRKDISALAQTQLALLNACWHLLKPGGVLLYATCSVLPQENERVVGQFLKQANDAQEEIILLSSKANELLQQTSTSFGRQLLPTINGQDGFYYAKLKKSNAE